jgi:hypothetical protein
MPEVDLTVVPDEYLSRTYVFDGREMKLTGRTALQKKKSGTTLIVWEICPLSVATTSPKNTAFNKWVKPSDLFHIRGSNKLAATFEAEKLAALKAQEEARLAQETKNAESESNE